MNVTGAFALLCENDRTEMVGYISDKKQKNKKKNLIHSMLLFTINFVILWRMCNVNGEKWNGRRKETSKNVKNCFFVFSFTSFVHKLFFPSSCSLLVSSLSSTSSSSVLILLFSSLKIRCVFI